MILLSNFTRGQRKAKHNALNELREKYHPGLSTNEFKTFPMGIRFDEIYFMIEDSIYLMDREGQDLKFRNLGISLNIPAITGITMTADHANIFVSSEIGLFHLRKKSFTTFFDNKLKSSQSYKGHLELKEGEIITDNNRLIKNTVTSGFMTENPCVCLTKDNQSEILFGTYDFMSRINKNSYKLDTLAVCEGKNYFWNSESEGPFAKEYKQCMVDHS